jgi:hypothetical protein
LKLTANATQNVNLDCDVEEDHAMQMMLYNYQTQVLNKYGARFRQKFTLEDAFKFHAFAPLEASKRVINGIPLGRPPSYRFTL